FKHNTSGNGFLQVWMNGQQIANYQGNLGYNTGYKDYAKFGYYNWTASSMNGTARKVLLRSPTIVSDPTGQTYTLEQISALIGSAMWPTRRQLRRSPYSRLGSRLRHYVAVYLAPRAVCCRNATTRTIAESRRRGCA
ncbi:MAG TPA: hypothetical protein VFT23_10845, partial [Burkholderiales bacterium]|nr:hypothetical protein [Burkholderiales bacterium]